MEDEIVVRLRSPTKIEEDWYKIEKRLKKIDTRLPTDVERSDAVSGVEPVETVNAGTKIEKDW